MEKIDKINIRWWPAVIVIIADIIASLWVWFYQETGQSAFLMACQLLTLLLLVLWFSLLSRVPTKQRLKLFACIALIAILFFLLFKIDGHSGDVIPHFSWRWKSKQKAVFANTKLTKHKDYPQFLGSNRNGIIYDVNLSSDWEKHPPKLLWKIPEGAGWSAFAVKQNQAITQEQAGKEEKIVCYELNSGKMIWSYSYPAYHNTPLGGPGPRATPTINGNKVYSLGATGILNCLELTLGKLLWSKDILKENKASNVKWGKSCSPLILNNLVVVSAGGVQKNSLVAYNKNTGEKVWQDGYDESSYASPLLAVLADVPQIIIFNKNSVASHDPKNGQVLWEHPWKDSIANATQPIPIGNKLLLASGYGVGSQLLQISKRKGRLYKKILWKSRRMKPKFTNLVYKDGYVYGLDSGVLACMDVATGKRLWRKGRYRHGQILLVKDLLLVQAEQDYIALVKADFKNYKELARFSTLKGINWNTPALAGRYLIVRNSQQAACYELMLKQ